MEREHPQTSSNNLLHADFTANSPNGQKWLLLHLQQSWKEGNKMYQQKGGIMSSIIEL